MTYSEQFIAFREGRGLSREELAARANCHRNTVINVESGRPVKFRTIVRLMARMDYPPDCPEVKLLALLWLQSTTGIQVAAPEARQLLRRGRAGKVWKEFEKELATRHLAPDEIELLTFALRHKEVLSALRAMRDLVHAGR